MFVVEYILEQDLRSDEPEWKILVHGDRWVYRQKLGADRVIEGCQPDHDDDIRCCYRVRDVSNAEALQLAEAVPLLASDVPVLLNDQ